MLSSRRPQNTQRATARPNGKRSNLERSVQVVCKFFAPQRPNSRRPGLPRPLIPWAWQLGWAAAAESASGAPRGSTLGGSLCTRSEACGKGPRARSARPVMHIIQEKSRGGAAARCNDVDGRAQVRVDVGDTGRHCFGDPRAAERGGGAPSRATASTPATRGSSSRASCNVAMPACCERPALGAVALLTLGLRSSLAGSGPRLGSASGSSALWPEGRQGGAAPSPGPLSSGCSAVWSVSAPRSGWTLRTRPSTLQASLGMRSSLGGSVGSR